MGNKFAAGSPGLCRSVGRVKREFILPREVFQHFYNLPSSTFAFNGRWDKIE